MKGKRAMDIPKLTRVLLWCTVINGAILVLATLGCVFFPDPGFTWQSQWFQIPRETLNVVIYAFLGGFKALWLVFNLVPYAALVIAGRS